jgi:thymidine kinase
MSTNASNNKLLSSLNQWCADLSCHDLDFSFHALPKPIPNKTYRLSKANVKTFVTITKGNPLFTIAYDADLVPTITLKTFKTSLDGYQYVGSAIEALCDAVYSDLDDIEPPAAGEKVISASNKTFNLVKAHLDDPRNKAKKQLPNRYLASKGLSNSDWSLHFQGLPLYLKDYDDESKAYSDGLAYRNGLYVPFFDVNHELVAYQLIIDRYEVPKTIRRGKFLVETGGFTASEYTPTAKYVDSKKRFYVEFEGGKVGAYGVIGNEYEPQQGEIFVFEGLATAISFLKIHPAACGVISGSAGNTSPCVQTLLNQANKGEFEGLKRIIICADNDIGTFKTQLSKNPTQACNAGIYAGVQAYIAHKDNALGVDIAICAIPDEFALNHAKKTDFDDYRQHLATVGKTLSSNWKDYQLDIMQLLKKPIDYCSQSKAEKLVCSNKKVLKSIKPNINQAVKNENLAQHLLSLVTENNRIIEHHKQHGHGLIELNSPLLPDSIRKEIINNQGVIYLKSAMGTGKTHQLKRVIKQALDRGENVLYCTPSTTLHSQIIAEFRQSGLQAIDYSDINYTNTLNSTDNKALAKPHVAVCVINSVLKFQGGTYHTIIIDESDQCLNNITNLVDYPADFIREFGFMLKHAKRVVACYAQLSMLTVDFFNSLQQQFIVFQKSTLIINHLNSATGKTVYKMPSVATAYAKINDLLSKGKKVLVLSNSSKETKRIYSFIDNLQFTDKPRVFILNNEEATLDISKFIKGIDDNIRQYDVVIASPKLSSGVSIDADYFDAIVGVFLQTTKDTPDLISNVQQLGRARKVKDLYIYAAPHTNYSLPVDTTTLYNQQKEHLAAFKPQCDLDKVGDIITMSSSSIAAYEAYVKLFLTAKAQRNLLDRNQQASLWQLLENEGYMVKEYGKKEALPTPEIIAAVAEHKERIKLSDALAIAETSSISAGEYENITMSREATKEEKLAARKHEIEMFLGITPKLDDVIAWQERVQTKIEWQELIMKTDSQLTEADDRLFTSHVEKKTLISYNSLIAKKQYAALLHSVYFDDCGNPYSAVHRYSSSVVAAQQQLMSMVNDAAVRFGSSTLDLLQKNPLQFINTEMLKMGYVFSCTKVRKGEKTIRTYSCSIDQAVMQYVAHRTDLGLSGLETIIIGLPTNTNQNETVAHFAYIDSYPF